MPSEIAVSRSTLIERPPADVFPHVNDLRAFQAWSPWAELDPDAMITFSGAESGVGQSMTWSSENEQVGNGRQMITASEENRRVATALDFGDMGMATSEIRLTPENEGQATRVDWAFETDMGLNPIARWMGLMMDGWVGADYERGLGNLKRQLEAG
ncbi:MAG: SRPBCC family protein [Pseudomonadota bacterium]